MTTFINWWGFSPALDFQQEYYNLFSQFQKLKVEDEEKEEELDQFNVLMLGAGDCRHILKTLAHAKRKSKKTINIYVIEKNIELLARHLLLMSIALEPKERLGLQEKTELFLELYGNSLIRPQTSEYLQRKSTEFIRMVTDLDYFESCLPCFNLSQLKYLERDLLEAVFKFWRNTDPRLFDMFKIWESRVRQHLAARYDYRANAYDWDLVMKLKIMAPIVSDHEYKSWREQGVAFELRQDSTYEVSNRSLASELVLKSGQPPCRGYWGDIMNSPYISFGIESEEQRLFKVNNGQHIKTATDVAEFNITALMHELMTGDKYILPDDEIIKKPKPPEKATITEVIEEEEGEEEEEVECKEKEAGAEQQSNTDKKNKSQKNEAQGYLKLDGFKIHFLPTGFLADFHKRPKHSRRFHCVYFSNSLTHVLYRQVKEIFADKAVVILESGKFQLDFAPKFTKEFMDEILERACSAGCKPLRDYDGQKDAHAIFSFERADQQD